MRTHKHLRQLNTFEELMPVLYNRKTIYFAPANRVLPTKFFMGWAWMSGAVKTHLENGSFVEVEKYSSILRNKISSICQSAKLNLK